MLHPAVHAQTAVDHYHRETGSESDDRAATLADLIADPLRAQHHHLEWESAAERAYWYTREERCWPDHAAVGDTLTGDSAGILRAL